jgi:2-polyprenyl-3-methyl-5-hydroxy-6-metoxy-1,4-benzoquinol methylase
MTIDSSEGWNDTAGNFLGARSAIGATLVRDWARDHLRPAGDILDVACGHGAPIAKALVEDGFRVFGVDASPRLLAEFRRRFPDVPSACERAQDSTFFHRSFDGVISIGFLFLLGAEDQRQVLRRLAGALNPGGQLLFTAPLQVLEWQDSLTGRTSRSLGGQAYQEILEASGLRLIGCRSDEGENNYFHAAAPPA